ncbi:hypothetical protein ScPMuIL_015505 [Solemya velum]
MATSSIHPLSTNRRKLERQLSRDDIGNQARVLLNGFIHDRMVRDGMTDAPAVEELQEPGTPVGPPMEHVQEIARALRCIGDELDRDEKIQSMIAKIPPDAPHQSFLKIAGDFFSDNIYNWGRVVALFYFAYRMALKALDRIPLIRAIINWVINFIVDKVAPWIIERGGWGAIVEYFGTPANQVAAVMITGVVASAAVLLYKSFN